MFHPPQPAGGRRYLFFDEGGERLQGCLSGDLFCFKSLIPGE